MFIKGEVPECDYIKFTVNKRLERNYLRSMKGMYKT